MVRPLLTLLAALMISVALPATASADSPISTDLVPVTVTAAEEAAPVADEAPAEEAPAEEAAAEEAAPEFDANQFRVDNLWILIAAFLVFIMHLGFSALETGLTQAKNTTNILFKNVFIICIGLITYAICGFNLMYPGDFNGYVGFGGFFIPDASEMDNTDLINPVAYGLDMTTWADFLFQGMFAATAATIISGCVAERIKLLPFLVFATIYVAILYPIVGSWHWGGGWLGDLETPFYDFAGSTLVHSVGGWGGLAAILLLGPRKGKYVDGQIRPILPSNLPLAAVGVFLLWFGWFGFNGGSVLNADPVAVSYVCVTTALAAAMGGVTAGICSWIFGKKPDLSMALNGILAGLVGITAGPDTTMLLTTIIGISSGAIVYFSVLFFDKIKIDDPVGALSVHLTCGIWGTFMAGFMEANSVVTQLIAIVAYGVVSFAFALVTGLIVKAIFGWRVSEEEEMEGLDIGEHGVSAYAIAES